MLFAPDRVEYYGDDPLDCSVEPESEGEWLRRTRDDRFGSGREVGSLSMCVSHEVKVSAEVWEFECPYN